VELVIAILEYEGFEVIGVNSGQECLEKLKKVKPDLILMDMMMPNISGRETTEKIRANPKTKNLKIAFLTVARFSEVGKDVLKKMKVLDYITKPFDNEDLVRRVKKLVG
jgi:CheY-like chemotaxis protein